MKLVATKDSFADKLKKNLKEGLDDIKKKIDTIDQPGKFSLGKTSILVFLYKILKFQRFK